MLTVTAIGIRSWQATFTAPANQSTKRWLTVTGTDVNGNVEALGDDSPRGDLLFFQVDTLAPLVNITPPVPEEGDIFTAVLGQTPLSDTPGNDVGSYDTPTTTVDVGDGNETSNAQVDILANRVYAVLVTVTVV